MTDYFTPTVVQPEIPNACMTPLERLLLTHIFDTDENGDALYFHHWDCPQTMLSLDTAELGAAIAASQDYPSEALPTILEQLSNCEPDQTIIYLDLSGMSWEVLFQEILKRTTEIAFISIISSFTCSKMRSDGFGGMAVLITATNIRGKSTHDIFEDLLEEEKSGLFAPASSQLEDATNV